jgi:hypothetical protein
MKNLFQGQEISMFKETRIVRIISKYLSKDSETGCLITLFYIFLKLISVLFLPIVGGVVVLIIAKELQLNSKELVVGVVFCIILLAVFILYRKYKNLQKNGVFNPSVVYYDDCLLILKNPSDKEGNEEFLGEIPFKGIKRFVFQDGKIVKVILNEDYISSFSKINNGEFDFHLHPDLRKIGLQIVEELNSKVNKG